MVASDSALISLATSMAAHAAKRQSVVAENIANANTPNYKARDLQAFQEAFRESRSAQVVLDGQATVKPDGNSVSLEQQVMKLTESRGQHEMALGLWERTLTMYRTALGRSG